jgi:hypothetical protein
MLLEGQQLAVDVRTRGHVRRTSAMTLRKPLYFVVPAFRSASVLALQCLFVVSHVYVVYTVWLCESLMWGCRELCTSTITSFT